MKKSKTIMDRFKTAICSLNSIISICGQLSSNLTAFNASSNMSNCDVNAPSYPDTYYHDGEGEYPVVGDTVYTDSQEENLLTNTIIVSEEPANLPLNENGVVQAFNCE